jgi:hypothetical protein
MRSTRATAAVARLNARSEGRHYVMALTGTGQFILRERIDGDDRQLSDALALDDFVRLVDSMGPKKVPRVTNYEAAFMKQLVKKDVTP